MVQTKLLGRQTFFLIYERGILFGGLWDTNIAFHSLDTWAGVVFPRWQRPYNNDGDDPVAKASMMGSTRMITTSFMFHLRPNISYGHLWF